MVRTRLARRRWSRLATLVAVGAIGLAPWLASAGAGSPVPDRQGWYWDSNARAGVAGTGAQQELFPASAEQFHLQVGLASGRENKHTFVGFDVASLDGFDGATVESFTFVALVSPPTDQHRREHVDHARASSTTPVPPATSNDQAARMVACPVTTFLADGADGDPMRDAQGAPIEPRFDCAMAQVDGRRAPDGASWSFDLTPIAALWASGSLDDSAIVLKPAPSPPQPPAPDSSWTVELHGRQFGGLAASAAWTSVTGESFEATPFVFGGEGSVLPTTFEASGDTVTPAPPDASLTTRPASFPRPASRVPWYAGLPILIGGLAFAWAWRALRGPGPRRAAEHHVVELLHERQHATHEGALR